jgi:acetyltransferase-like isoleucine patch superfamily enzyme
MDLIIRIFEGLASRLRGAFYRSLGLRMEGKCWLRAIEIPRNHAGILLHADVALDRGVVLLLSGESCGKPKIEIGAKTYINRYTIVDASEEIVIGPECMIGPHCYIADHDHAVGAQDGPAAGPLRAAPTRIEERSWIGAHVTILKGVTVGKGTVVGAGSVVTKSLPPGVIAVGNPARVLREISNDE